ncbi:MAG: nitroreductase family protein [Desulfobacteraceae bacterium]|jgi:nitroreductase/NAD-dependent dihydropyrimidine dehydrogenase PreA subunit
MNDLQFKIDAEQCLACEACVTDCPFGVLAMADQPILENPDNCIACQHCLAICPTGALSILGHHAQDSTDLTGRLPSFAQMDTLIKGRRSIRQYASEPLSAEMLNTLLTTAWHAPTAVNNQSVRFTVLDDPTQVKALSDECWQRLNDMERVDALPEGPLRNYVNLGKVARQNNNSDIFFRGAPHLIITSSPKSNPAAQTDTVIALSYLELAAQSMKLATLWNGLAKTLICNIFPDLCGRLSIPTDHLVGGMMLLGKPAVEYVRTIERAPANIVRTILAPKELDLG